MKELSIEEKAQAYDEALEKARQLCAYPTTKPFINDLQDLFPELKESEDERIKKTLINFFSKGAEYDSSTNGIKDRDIIAWLEKQGKEKLTDKPKFKVGDEIKTKNEESLIITRIDRWGYWSEDLFICNFDDADNWELVEQKPAWGEQDREMIDETLYFIREYQQSNRCKDENGMQNSVTCEKWLKSLKERIGE